MFSKLLFVWCSVLAATRAHLIPYNLGGTVIMVDSEALKYNSPLLAHLENGMPTRQGPENSSSESHSETLGTISDDQLKTESNFNVQETQTLSSAESDFRKDTQGNLEISVLDEGQEVYPLPTYHYEPAQPIGWKDAAGIYLGEQKVPLVSNNQPSLYYSVENPDESHVSETIHKIITSLNQNTADIKLNDRAPVPLIPPIPDAQSFVNPVQTTHFPSQESDQSTDSFLSHTFSQAVASDSDLGGSVVDSVTVLGDNVRTHIYHEHQTLGDDGDTHRSDNIPTPPSENSGQETTTSFGLFQASQADREDLETVTKIAEDSNSPSVTIVSDSTEQPNFDGTTEQPLEDQTTEIALEEILTQKEEAIIADLQEETDIKKEEEEHQVALQEAMADIFGSLFASEPEESAKEDKTPASDADSESSVNSKNSNHTVVQHHPDTNSGVHSGSTEQEDSSLSELSDKEDTSSAVEAQEDSDASNFNDHEETQASDSQTPTDLAAPEDLKNSNDDQENKEQETDFPLPFDLFKEEDMNIPNKDGEENVQNDKVSLDHSNLSPQEDSDVSTVDKQGTDLQTPSDVDQEDINMSNADEPEGIQQDAGFPVPLDFIALEDSEMSATDEEESIQQETDSSVHSDPTIQEDSNMSAASDLTVQDDSSMSNKDAEDKTHQESDLPAPFDLTAHEEDSAVSNNAELGGTHQQEENETYEPFGLLGIFSGQNDGTEEQTSHSETVDDSGNGEPSTVNENNNTSEQSILSTLWSYFPNTRGEPEKATVTEAPQVPHHSQAAMNPLPITGDQAAGIYIDDKKVYNKQPDDQPSQYSTRHDPPEHDDGLLTWFDDEPIKIFDREVASDASEVANTPEEATSPEEVITPELANTHEEETGAFDDDFAEDQANVTINTGGAVFHSVVPDLLHKSTCRCGIRFNQKIVGGDPTDIDQYPWMAGITTKSDDFTFCGGSLLNDLYVLTAAHCLYQQYPDDIYVRFGETTRDSYKSVNVDVEKMIIHPKYDINIVYKADIGLIKLKQPIPTFTDKIFPVCLALGKETYADFDAQVSGWGRNSFGGDVTNGLMEATVRVLSTSTCRRESAYEKFEVHKKVLCALGKGIDACQGDSGGPLVVLEGDRYKQVGIVSWGIGCAQQEYPGIYTRVSSYSKWILKNSKDGTGCQYGKTSKPGNKNKNKKNKNNKNKLQLGQILNNMKKGPGVRGDEGTAEDGEPAKGNKQKNKNNKKKNKNKGQGNKKADEIEKPNNAWQQLFSGGGVGAQGSGNKGKVKKNQVKNGEVAQDGQKTKTGNKNQVADGEQAPSAVDAAGETKLENSFTEPEEAQDASGDKKKKKKNKKKNKNKNNNKRRGGEVDRGASDDGESNSNNKNKNKGNRNRNRNRNNKNRRKNGNENRYSDQTLEDADENEMNLENILSEVGEAQDSSPVVDNKKNKKKKNENNSNGGEVDQGSSVGTEAPDTKNSNNKRNKNRNNKNRRKNQEDDKDRIDWGNLESALKGIGGMIVGEQKQASG
ncbi:uncharacterized protein LOC135200367 isoform X2 [Macrobrachium nipponense]|uniref:uncharacterized protein LOC135200367 isoform X2 n=1 Tax=Macrobrachium nipponense TaxID=159736 RepID=UPI0030C8C621